MKMIVHACSIAASGFAFAETEKQSSTRICLKTAAAAKLSRHLVGSGDFCSHEYAHAVFPQPDCAHAKEWRNPACGQSGAHPVTTRISPHPDIHRHWSSGWLRGIQRTTNGPRKDRQGGHCRPRRATDDGGHMHSPDTPADEMPAWSIRLLLS